VSGRIDYGSANSFTGNSFTGDSSTGAANMIHDLLFAIAVAGIGRSLKKLPSALRQMLHDLFLALIFTCHWF
jgi:hypothetical protein